MSLRYIVHPNPVERETTPALRIADHQLATPVYKDWMQLQYEKEMGGDVHVPIGLNGRKYFPIEASTGVPLPIIVEKNGPNPNLHHAFTRKSQFARGTDGQKATRFSRLQRIEIKAHEEAHDKYDRTTGFGMEYEEFASVVLSCSGYIPPWGLDAGQGMAIVELTPEQRRRLRKPGIITVEPGWESQATIGEFAINYGLSQDFGSKWQLYIEELLSITPEQMQQDKYLRRRKMLLGKKLADRAISYAVDPVVPQFVEARNNNLLRKHSPPSPWPVLKNIIQGAFETYHLPEIELALSDRYFGPVTADA